MLSVAEWSQAMTEAHGVSARRTSLGYDAVNSRGKRQSPTGILRSEEQELPGTARRRLLSTGRDLKRNFALVGWMVRRHLDYVTTFRFQGRTGSNDLNRRVEALVAEWSEKDNCDIARRHHFENIVRIGEALRVLDGDVFVLKLRDGRIQPLEGDLIRQAPGSFGLNDYGHGVHLDAYRGAKAFDVCRRRWSGGFQFVRTVPACHMVQHADWERFDQCRGVSPLASAFNSLRDVYENFDYALARAKLAQLLGIVITRKAAESIGIETETVDSSGAVRKDYEVDLTTGRPQLMDMEPGDDFKFVESNNPSANFQQFHTAVTAVALKALDIPFSFYDEAYTNYSGSRSAKLEYEAGAKIKRKNVRRFEDAILRWRFQLWEDDGRLPKSVRAEDIRWELVHAGVAWVDPLNEVQADILANDAGLRTKRQILAEQGIDLDEHIAELADEKMKFAAAGLAVGPVTVKGDTAETKPTPAPQGGTPPTPPKPEAARRGWWSFGRREAAHAA